MASFDDVQAKQRLLDDAVAKQRRYNEEIQRLNIDLQNKRDQLMSHYAAEIAKSEKEMRLADSKATGFRQEIDSIQNEQSKLQQRLSELQANQTKLQVKMSEQQKLQMEGMTKLSGIQRDQQRALERLDTDIKRSIDNKRRELDQVNRALGTLQADLTRAIEKQQRASVANTNNSLSTAGRKISGLRKF